ncbi:MAG TPA: hypothetical protein VLB89_04150 [Gaiellaceae bacterium]|nr:hypothetical protein [Gaiellaceae bacterium]
MDDRRDGAPELRVVGRVRGGPEPDPRAAEFVGAVSAVHQGTRWSLQQMPSKPACSASIAWRRRSSGGKRSCASALQ